jgi:hypothetical protein
MPVVPASSRWTSAYVRRPRSSARAKTRKSEKRAADPGRLSASASALSAGIAFRVTSVETPLESCATQAVTRFVAPPSLKRRRSLADAHAATTSPEKPETMPFPVSATTRKSDAETSPKTFL